MNALNSAHDCRALRTGAAFHSHHMHVAAAHLRGALKNSGPRFECQRTAIPLFSTVTGACVSGRKLDSQYWEDNLRQPVKFWTAVTAAMNTNLAQGDDAGRKEVSMTC